MKRVIFFLVFLLLAISAVAQNLPDGDPRNEGFRRHFLAVVEANPDVADFYKMPNGAVYRLPDGTTDRVPAGRYGIWGREFQKTYGVPYEQFARTGNIRPIPEGVRTPTPTVKAAQVATTPTKAKEKFYTLSSYATLALMVILIIIFLLSRWIYLARKRLEEEEMAANEAALENAAAATLERKREEERERAAAAHAEAEAAASTMLEEEDRNRNPVTFGTPYVPGGIASHETERLTNFFASQAISHYSERTGQDLARILVSQVGPIEQGVVHGDGEVGFLDARGFQHFHIAEPGIRAYRARFRFPDGTEEELICLVGCMNPTRGFWGDVYRGFTFVPDQAVVAPPAIETVTVPEDATITVVDEPEAELVGGPDAPEIVSSSDGVIRLEVKPPTPGKPLTLVSMSGVDPGTASVELKGNTISFKFLPATPTTGDEKDSVRISPEARHLAG